MVDATKTEHFDESFATDDFAFLEEEELKTEADPKLQTAAAAAKKSTAAKKLPIKWLAIIGVLIFGFVISKMMQKKPATAAAPATISKKQADGEPNAEHTITMPMPTPDPSTANTTQKADNSSTVHAAPAAGTPAATQDASTAVSKTQAATPPNPGIAASPATTPSPALSNEEKSRQEMADLFANSSAEQNNSLANALAQQEKAKESAQPGKNTDLYFGNNVPRNKSDKKDDNAGQNHELTKQNSQLQLAVESISQEMTENVNHLKQLDGKLHELTNTLAKLNQNIGAMDARILGVTEAIDSITQDVSQVKKVIADEDLDVTTGKATADPQLTYKPPGYSIHAIIPGRAWLKASSGQIITIAEGDVIGDYGTVAVIDAANNIVRTSSGVSFR